MATISEDADNVHTYIEEKKRYEDEGWEVSFDGNFICLRLLLFSQIIELDFIPDCLHIRIKIHI